MDLLFLYFYLLSTFIYLILTDFERDVISRGGKIVYMHDYIPFILTFAPSLSSEKQKNLKSVQSVEDWTMENTYMKWKDQRETKQNQ